MDKLRIALVAPPWFSVPPPGYGGTERVVSYLAEGLSARGHEVTLFASGGSTASTDLRSLFAEPPSALLGDLAIEVAHAAFAYREAGAFDVIHDHTVTGLAGAVACRTPVAHTIHGPVAPQTATLYSVVSPPVKLISISNHQRSTLPAGLDVSTIYNAIALDGIPFSSSAGDYLLFVGRMCRDKGILEAIEIARRADLPLLVVAKINEPAERRYFEEVVRPTLAGIRAELWEQPPEHKKWEAFAGAMATLFPIRWPEPFGLVMIESMAAGTPVIAFNAGSVPEVIRDGETGFICETVEEAVARVDDVPALTRERCREHVLNSFSADLAVLRHEKLYLDLVSGRYEEAKTAVDEEMLASAAVPQGSGRVETHLSPV